MLLNSVRFYKMSLNCSEQGGWGVRTVSTVAICNVAICLSLFTPGIIVILFFMYILKIQNHLCQGKLNHVGFAMCILCGQAIKQSGTFWLAG